MLLQPSPPSRRVMPPTPSSPIQPDDASESSLTGGLAICPDTDRMLHNRYSPYRKNSQHSWGYFESMSGKHSQSDPALGPSAIQTAPTPVRYRRCRRRMLRMWSPMMLVAMPYNQGRAI